VDDNPDGREMMAMFLTAQGFDTSVAGNGVEALSVARAILPHVIVLDMMMPVMDGWKFRARQQADPTLAGIAVVVLSALPPRMVRDVGAIAVLQKPFNPAELISVLRAHC
jgi:CheY-like chemotaxis protein